MKLHRTNKITALVPTASMADIAFLLIIFFMLTTTSSVDKADVDLAESLVRVEVEKEAAVISIDGRGDVRFSDGIETSQLVLGMDELSSRIQGVLRYEPHKEFIIKVDKNVKYSEFDRIYERVRNLQVRRINLLTEQKFVHQ